MLSHRLSLNQLLDTGLVFLENCANFLNRVADDSPESELTGTLQAMALEVGSRRKKLSDYQRRRQAQVRDDRKSVISAEQSGLLQSLEKLPIFRKPGIGESLADRVVSRIEAQERASHYSLLGFAYFELLRQVTRGRLRKLSGDIKLTMMLCTTKAVGIAAISRGNP